MHPCAATDDQMLDACERRAARRGGPGGQHRNRASTAVVLRHRDTGVEASASERRSAAENLRVALRRLRLALAIAVREPWESPSEAWRARAAGGRLSISPRAADLPALLAESLDAWATHQHNVPATAESLRVTTSQLVKLWCVEPAVLAHVNDQRRSAELPPLHPR
jgi:hypothetical protein